MVRQSASITSDDAGTLVETRPERATVSRRRREAATLLGAETSGLR